MVVNEKKILVLFESDIHRCKSICHEYCDMLNMPDSDRSALQIVASELSSNLIKHQARRGVFSVSLLLENNRKGIKIMTTDRGPGIADLEMALTDGFSTTGTLGGGLPAVRRLMDEFDIESDSSGTVVKAIKWTKPNSQMLIDFALTEKPAEGESQSGDCCFFDQNPNQVLITMTDVLGHGNEAHDVAMIAQNTIIRNKEKPPGEIMNNLHQALKKTRGAAVSILKIYPKTKIMEHLSIGNVETQLPNALPPIRPFCQNGIVGQYKRKLSPNQYRFDNLNFIVMYTDGISSSIQITRELMNASAESICQSLFAQYRKKHDDATLLVGKVVQWI